MLFNDCSKLNSVGKKDLKILTSYSNKDEWYNAFCLSLKVQQSPKPLTTAHVKKNNVNDKDLLVTCIMVSIDNMSGCFQKRNTGATERTLA